jgi:hypothetical protein
MDYQKRYNEEGQVAVLISPGFGAGWSTWSSDHAEALVFDSRLVDYVLLNGNISLGNYAKELGYDSYMGGAGDVVVIWVDAGTRFVIEEYDGSESIRTFEDLSYIA